MTWLPGFVYSVELIQFVFWKISIYICESVACAFELWCLARQLSIIKCMQNMLELTYKISHIKVKLTDTIYIWGWTRHSCIPFQVIAVDYSLYWYMRSYLDDATSQRSIHGIGFSKYHKTSTTFPVYNKLKACLIRVNMYA